MERDDRRSNALQYGIALIVVGLIVLWMGWTGVIE